MKTLLKIILFPFFFVYLATISLFIMPLIYGQRIWGLPLYVASWLLHLLLIPLIWLDTIQEFCHNLNKTANYAMGYKFDKTVSRQIGERIDQGNASCVEIIHCKILGVYDPRGTHCSNNCKGLF